MHAALIIVSVIWISGTAAAAVLLYYSYKTNKEPPLIVVRDTALTLIWPLFVAFIFIQGAAEALRYNRFPDTPF